MTKNKSILILLISLLLFSTASCRKDSPNVIFPVAGIGIVEDEFYWENVFQSYWDIMNHSYVFWMADETDWDEVYETYMPKFKELSSLYETTEAQVIKDSALTYFSRLSSTLIDHHYGLEIQGNPIGPGAFEKIKDRPNYYAPEYGDFFDNFYYRTIQDDVQNVIMDAFGNTFLCSFKDKDIVYLYISSFRLTDILYYDIKGHNYNTEFEDIIFNIFKELEEDPNIKGLILDVRYNGGGSLNDANILFSPFIKEGEEKVIAYTKRKSGIGRLDYTPLVPEVIKGSSEKSYTDLPVAVLVNLYSISMAEIAALCVDAIFENSAIIGDQTFGAQGPLTDHNFFAGGIIQTEDLYIYTSSTALFDINGNILEGKGVTPDILVPNESIDYKNKEDGQYDRAVEYLRSL